jgi:hypothetical protein
MASFPTLPKRKGKKERKGKEKKRKEKKRKNLKRLLSKGFQIRRLTNSILAVKMWKIARGRERQRGAKTLELCHQCKRVFCLFHAWMPSKTSTATILF